MKICVVPPRPGGDRKLTQKSHCDKQAGRLRPVIDRNRCEAKADCVTVCPYHVFEVGPVPVAERRALSVPGRIKLLVHGGKQAFAPRADACRACGLCVSVCPEQAITLVPVERVSSSTGNRGEEA